MNKHDAELLALRMMIRLRIMGLSYESALRVAVEKYDADSNEVEIAYAFKAAQQPNKEVA